MPFSTAQLLHRAGRAGTQIGVLCVAIYQRQGEAGIRRMLPRSRGLQLCVSHYNVGATNVMR